MEDRNQFYRIEKRLAEIKKQSNEIKNRWIKTKSWFLEIIRCEH